MFDQTVHRFKLNNPGISFDDDILGVLMGKQRNFFKAHDAIKANRKIGEAAKQIMIKSNNDLYNLLVAAGKKGINYNQLMEFINRY